MNPLSFVNIALQVLANAGTFESDVKNVLSANWNHDLVTNAKQGLSVLSKIVADVETALGGTPPDPNALAPLSNQ